MKNIESEALVTKQEWNEYKILLEYLNNEYSKFNGEYIISDDFLELKEYLES
jgi:hypothetical protein